MKYFLVCFFLFSCQSWRPMKQSPLWYYQLQSYSKTAPLPEDENLKVVDITYPHKVTANTLCYLSIGEAEDYRDYFAKLDKKLIKSENKQWAGNFPIKYWENEWKNIIFNSSDSYLDDIIKKHYSGVYLDIVDAFHAYKDKRKYATLMAQYIIELSTKAKQSRKNFKVYIQNGIDIVEYLDKNLLTNFLSAINGISLEAVFFNYNEHHQVKGISPDKDYYLGLINKYYTTNNIDILSVEYLVEKEHYAEYHQILTLFSQKNLITDKLLKGKYFYSLGELP